MQIRSEIIPSGEEVAIDLDAGRLQHEQAWDLPTWGHPLALAVYPLFVTMDRTLIPIGTAFCISKIGIVATALHNIHDALRHHPHADQLRRQGLPSKGTLDKIGLALFHHHATPSGDFTGNIRGLESCSGAPRSDVLFAFPQFQGTSPYLPLPISFAVPRIGSRVTCLGFTEMSVPSRGMRLDDLESGSASLLEVYGHRFRAIEGRVTKIFTQSFASSFIEGPCFVIDAEVEPGLSGGPIISESGHVCGIVSAGATAFFGKPTTIASLLYPALLTEISASHSLGPFRMKVTRPLVDYVMHGSVPSDGSASLVTVRIDDGQFVLGPAIRREDAAHAHDDFAGFQAGRAATPESREVFRVVPVQTPDDQT